VSHHSQYTPPVIQRHITKTLTTRLGEPRRFIQIVLGPRQVGKTTTVRQALSAQATPCISVSADELTVIGPVWIAEHWERARSAARASGSAILAIDEIQKISNWSETVKRLWDEDTASGTDVRVVLTGSSTMLLRKGLSESLAGRFEVLRATHWQWVEMREAFDCSFEDYLLFGGYPGPMSLRHDHERWLAYMRESIIESTLSLDVLQVERIDKPALLRNLLMLGTSLSGQIVSLQKLLGQLQDSGNAATIAHYLSLLSDSGMLAGLQKYTSTMTRSKAASPKLQVFAPALMTAVIGVPYATHGHSPEQLGRLTESAIGAHLLSLTNGSLTTLQYWREGKHEVDFVLSAPGRCVLIEVKSGTVRNAYSGSSEFRKHHGSAKLYVLGGKEHMPVEEFLSATLSDLMS